MNNRLLSLIILALSIAIMSWSKEGTFFVIALMMALVTLWPTRREVKLIRSIIHKNKTKNTKSAWNLHDG